MEPGELSRALCRFEAPPWRQRAACIDDLEAEVAANPRPTSESGVFGGRTPAERRRMKR